MNASDLEQRLAMSEAAERALGTVIEIIARSAGDLTTSMDAILDGALDLCEAQLGILFRYDTRKGYRAEHMKGVPESFEAYLRDQGWFRVSPGTGLGRVEEFRQPVNIADVVGEEIYSQREPLRVATADLGGARSYLAVPMMSGTDLVGAFSVYRKEVQPFTEQHALLLKRFADHSVVALENARLFHETKALSVELAELNRTLQERVDAQVRELKRLSTLRRFLPQQVAELVLAGEHEELLASHRRKIAALFCDLRGFTAFSEAAEPEEVMEVLGEFHGLAGAVISAHGGTITNRAGDSVMVVLNDPLPVEDAADQAIQLAIALRDVLLEACGRWQNLGYSLGVGIGIATGYATLGLVASAGQYEYTAVGTVVNMAARLCAEASHGQILATRRLLAECKHAPDVDELGRREMRGVSRPVELVALTSATASARSPSSAE